MGEPLSDGKTPRFLVRGSSGEEIPLASVSELEERVRAGEIRPGDELYDAGTGAWAPAWKVSLYRFIIEELERDDELPESLRAALREALEGRVDEDGQLKAEPDLPKDPGSLSDPDDALLIDDEHLVPVEDEPEEEDDPLDFELELVDADPFGLPSHASGPGDRSSRTESGTDEGESDELEDFELRLGSSAEFDWDDVDPGATPGTADPEAEPAGADDASRQPPRGESAPKGISGRASTPKPDRPSEGDEDDEEQDWFTPHEEGGMVLPDLHRVADEPDHEAETWKPGADEPDPTRRAPLIQRTPYRPRAWVVGLLILVVGVAAWLALLPDERDPGFEEEAVTAETVPAPDLPPFPDGLEAEGEQVLARVGEVFEVASDSLRNEIGLERVPPRTWLSGLYLANAGQFPRIVGFWEDYLEFLDRLRPRDETLYLGAVAETLDGLDTLGEEDREQLEEYFRVRYERQRDYREARYEHLASTSRAAIQLHQVLQTHQSEIAYSPAVGSGVSADPILEAVIPEGDVRRDVEWALDRVFGALDRSRGGGVPSADGLRAELFLRFGEG